MDTMVERTRDVVEISGEEIWIQVELHNNMSENPQKYRLRYYKYYFCFWCTHYHSTVLILGTTVILPRHQR